MLPVITQVVNSSLTIGIFPSKLRDAIVLPILKKATMDPNVLKHYSPVSNIAFMSKVIESAVSSQLTTHLEDHNLDDP